MKLRDGLDLVVLAALWGGSFLFLRVAAPALGPVPLIALRVGIAAAALLPVALWLGGLAGLRGRLVHVAVVGVINSALPFCLLAYALLSLSAGLASVLNATSPLWGSLVAHVWLKDRLTASRAAGIALGFGGVAFLVWGRGGAASGTGPAILAALAATLSYGLAASYTKRYLRGVSPLAAAAGSQVAATLVLVPPALALWPSQPVAPVTWAAVGALGVACTAVAYVLYFRLIERIGPARAVSVTFLVPAFAMAWGALLLGERPGAPMLAGAAVVLAGTALATGLVKLPVGTARMPPARAPGGS